MQSFPLLYQAAVEIFCELVSLVVGKETNLPHKEDPKKAAIITKKFYGVAVPSLDGFRHCKLTASVFESLNGDSRENGTLSYAGMEPSAAYRLQSFTPPRVRVNCPNFNRYG